MNRLLRLTTLSFVGFASFSGCTKTDSQIDPCSLLSVSDVLVVDNTVVQSQWIPPEKAEAKENQLCLYVDGKNERRFMLFLWVDDPRNPRAIVEEGITNASIQIVEVSGVGTQAVAAFKKDLKLFAAKSHKGIIGIRVRKIVKEGSVEFESLKDLMNLALSRIK